MQFVHEAYHVQIYAKTYGPRFHGMPSHKIWLAAMPFTKTKRPKPNLLTYQRRGKKKDVNVEVSLGRNISVIEINEPL